jgi:hypothetical protein
MNILISEIYIFAPLQTNIIIYEIGLNKPVRGHSNNQ